MAAVTASLPLLATGGNTTGFEIPAELVEQLGGGRKPKVTVTLNGRHTYRSSVAVMGGMYMLGVSAANRHAASIAAGEVVRLDLVLDTAPREVERPPDLSAALDANAAASKAFEALSYSDKRRHLLAIEDAKTPETRARRIAKTVETVQQLKK